VALSVTVTEAVRVPVAVGLNLTLIVQPLPALSELPQVVVLGKSPLLAPVIAILVILSGALPVFLSVTLFDPLVVPTLRAEKVKLVGERLTAGAVGPAPVPVKPIECGVPAALSLIDTAAVRVPVAVGVNVTLNVQLALVPSEVPQVVVYA